MASLKDSTNEGLVYAAIATAIAASFALAVMDGASDDLPPEPPAQEQNSPAALTP